MPEIIPLGDVATRPLPLPTVWSYKPPQAKRQAGPTPGQATGHKGMSGIGS